MRCFVVFSPACDGAEERLKTSSESGRKTWWDREGVVEAVVNDLWRRLTKDRLATPHSSKAHKISLGHRLPQSSSVAHSLS